MRPDLRKKTRVGPGRVLCRYRMLSLNRGYANSLISESRRLTSSPTCQNVDKSLHTKHKCQRYKLAGGLLTKARVYDCTRSNGGPCLGYHARSWETRNRMIRSYWTGPINSTYHSSNLSDFFAVQLLRENRKSNNACDIIKPLTTCIKGTYPYT